MHYCLDAADFEYSDIEAIALCTPQKLTKINDLDLFRYIDYHKKYAETFYVPHHFSHMEYIAHYGNLEPGIILIIVLSH